MFDPACYTLARHFLGATASEDFALRLSQHIQDEIESWMRTEVEDTGKTLTEGTRP